MISSTFNDDYFMKKAFEEAQAALEEGEVPVGAIIVAENKIIGRGHNQTEILHDVTAHAEIIAISAASNYLGSKYLKDCRLYVTLEPCAMCAAAINAAQLESLVFAADDPKKGYRLYKPSLIHPKLKVISGIRQDECRMILQEFFVEKRNKNDN
ncbi:MAG: nucleoside deaminase [Bacteroidetes bacterium]|jgi:tRNA(adenine34) deaminase|nr:nucleoside deaminase [Bacteroidota bacterium]MBT7039453.1 nucleoside deaminase [Bacteroidota bacterium]